MKPTQRKDPSKIDDLDKFGSFKQLELTPREIKQLKYDARKRKWVRRCRLANDYLHAICKWILMVDLVSSLGSPLVPGSLQN
jgi:hypothetical protein